MGWIQTNNIQPREPGQALETQETYILKLDKRATVELGFEN